MGWGAKYCYCFSFIIYWWYNIGGVKSWANVRALKAMLILFKAIFGLKVNFHKSMLFGVNVSESWLHKALMVMNSKHDWQFFLYLGLPIGGDCRKLSFSLPLIDCIKRRLSGWKSLFLSMESRLILIKFVMSSIPVYFVSFFKSPSSIIYSLEYIFNVFSRETVRKWEIFSWTKWNTIWLKK